ncbi:MAG TPA: hypothetical protein VHX42_01260, partial [Candidatus Babeliales bacterium]|nr:hypothetical protein [Candidatus Babeliales bacterium]
MKHHVCAVLLFVSSLVCAEFDKYALFEKEYRIGRFNDEDSFDMKEAAKILQQLPVPVKKNMRKLLDLSDKDVIPQRLLLLGGIRNADTTDIAKIIALYWGYDYYLIEASVFLQACREGREDALLSEVRCIAQKGKPIVFIVTELAEMEDYFGLYAFTLQRMVDQCAEYPHVKVIATSAFQQEQLSIIVKEKFQDIVSVVCGQSTDIKRNWLERNKNACIVAAGFVLCSLAAIYVGSYILFATMQLQQQNENSSLNQKITDL